MPQEHFITGLQGVVVERVDSGRSVEVFARPTARPDCIRCGSSHLRIRSSFWRRLAHSRQGNQLIYVSLRAHKFECLRCKRFFNSRFSGVLPRRQSTETFRYEVFERHESGSSLSFLSRTFSISASTAERWYQSFVINRVKEMRSRVCPKVLGIDEHFFTRKSGYATTFVNLQKHKVHDVVLGRSALSLQGYLAKIPEKHRCKIAVIDLSETYRSIVKANFPNALIVADRFHVVKLLNHHFMKAWQQLHLEGRKNRGLTSLMRRHEWNLTQEQNQNLRRYLRSIPLLESIYDFKQKLARLMKLKKLTMTQARPKLFEFLEMIEQLIDAPMESLKTLGLTLKKWVEEIARMWRFSKTNGITEGFHTKMELLSRRAYGFRNFQNYRLRVLALCGWSGVINRVS